jgi:hypothetical protein
MNRFFYKTRYLYLFHKIYIKMKIQLTPGQSVTIHGWSNPKDTLSWTDILSKSNLTFKYLTKEANIPKELLHRLQPDIQAWKKAERIDLLDTPHLTPWSAHPIRDLQADLSDIIQLEWPAETLKRTGVTFQDLLDIGLGPETMGMFRYTLYDWSSIGFSKSEADKIQAQHLVRLFNLTKPDVMRCLK